MRYLVIIVTILIFSSCGIFEPVSKAPLSTPKPIVIHDTVIKPVYVLDTAMVDSLTQLVKELQYCNDSLLTVNDTIATRLLRYKLVVENVKHYVGICNRNRSQTKFLRGWINRAVKDY